MDGVDDFVGLFEEVRHERVVGLLDVPRALLAQGSGQLVEADVRRADRCAELGDPQRREVVGVDGAVDVGPGGVDDPLVGGAERMEQRDRFVAGGLVDRQLDVGQHPVGVSVSDEQWTGVACGGGGEVVAVDQADSGLDRVESEAGPGHVEKRHRRPDVAVDVVTGEQMAHGALEHQRRTGHRIEDLAVRRGGSSQRVGDLGVDVVEGVGGLVEVVERGGVGYESGRWVDRGAQESVGGAFDGVEGVDGDVFVATGAEADDNDPWPFGGHHRQPRGTTWPLVASKVP